MSFLDECLLEQTADICDFTHHINGQLTENVSFIDSFLLLPSAVTPLLGAHFKAGHVAADPVVHILSYNTSTAIIQPFALCTVYICIEIR